MRHVFVEEVVEFALVGDVAAEDVGGAGAGVDPMFDQFAFI